MYTFELKTSCAEAMTKIKTRMLTLYDKNGYLSIGDIMAEYGMRGDFSKGWTRRKDIEDAYMTRVVNEYSFFLGTDPYWILTVPNDPKNISESLRSKKTIDVDKNIRELWKETLTALSKWDRKDRDELDIIRRKINMLLSMVDYRDTHTNTMADLVKDAAKDLKENRYVH